MRVYPVITLIQSRIRIVSLKKTKNKAIERMLKWLVSNIPEGEVALVSLHTDAKNEATEINERLALLLKPQESYIIELSQVIGAHVGPGLVGVAWWKEPIKRK
jgi:fatty acid-binding protein DegV